MRIRERCIQGITQYSSDGVRAYQIPVESFPGHVTNVYLLQDQESTLIDVGFNRDAARADFERGFEVINGSFADPVSLESVNNIVITHGHGDHFGMLEHPRLKGKRLYMSPPDTRVIKDYPGEYREWRDYVGLLGEEAGCHINLEELFEHDRLDFGQDDYEIIEVHDLQKIAGSCTVHHTPGHSPGHICLGCGPFVFLGDHLLAVTTPHQVPKSGWSGAGLQTYLNSLAKVAGLGFALGLPAHEEVIRSVEGRAREIEQFHYRRLDEICGLCLEEKNLYELTRDYYAGHPELIQAASIDQLDTGDLVLALEEIKAHVEFLLESGRMTSAPGAGGTLRYLSG